MILCNSQVKLLVSKKKNYRFGDMKKEMPKTKTFLNPNPYFHAIDVEVTFVTPYNDYFQLLNIIEHVR